MGNSSTEIAKAAIAQVRRSKKGNVLAAHDVLRGAIYGLREVCAGRLPDLERRVYLKFLLRAMEKIDTGIEPSKALCLLPSNRPTSVPDARDLMLFIKVGQELDRPVARGAPIINIGAAIANVARAQRAGKDTVRKAWQKFGGKRAWRDL